MVWKQCASVINNTQANGLAAVHTPPPAKMAGGVGNIGAEFTLIVLQTMPKWLCQALAVVPFVLVRALGEWGVRCSYS